MDEIWMLMMTDDSTAAAAAGWPTDLDFFLVGSYFFLTILQELSIF
jgi:hypothetical protein